MLLKESPTTASTGPDVEVSEDKYVPDPAPHHETLRSGPERMRLESLVQQTLCTELQGPSRQLEIPTDLGGTAQNVPGCSSTLSKVVSGVKRRVEGDTDFDAATWKS